MNSSSSNSKTLWVTISVKFESFTVKLAVSVFYGRFSMIVSILNSPWIKYILGLYFNIEANIKILPFGPEDEFDNLIFSNEIGIWFSWFPVNGPSGWTYRPDLGGTSARKYIFIENRILRPMTERIRMAVVLCYLYKHRKWCSVSGKNSTVGTYRPGTSMVSVAISIFIFWYNVNCYVIFARLHQT